MKIKCIVSGKWVENCYVVSINNSAVIIDPGGNAHEVIEYVTDNKLTVHAIINTHAHFDHIGAVDELAKLYQCPFYLHSGDQRLLRSANLYMTLFLGEKPVVIPKVDFLFDKIDSPLEFGELSVEILHTPGHTDGSVCFLINTNLFTGDTLMKGTIGRLDLPGGNKTKMIGSLRSLSQLPEELVIYPGHGEPGILGEEITNNESVINLLK
jgi:hydroxyacylglutathione hydrolase